MGDSLRVKLIGSFGNYEIGISTEFFKRWPTGHLHAPIGSPPSASILH
jgi:hypothetical protein